MKKQCFVFSLLLVLILAACSKDDSRQDLIIYKSKPEISISEDGDSIYIKGYNTCTSVNQFKGGLPEQIANEFNLDKKYTYTVFKAVVESSEILGPDLLFSNPLNEDKWGYADAELSGKGCTQSGYTQGDQRYGNVYTYFLHISREINGDEMDLWLPYPPEDIYWRCRLFDTGE